MYTEPNVNFIVVSPLFSRWGRRSTSPTLECQGQGRCLMVRSFSPCHEGALGVGGSSFFFIEWIFLWIESKKKSSFEYCFWIESKKKNSFEYFFWIESKKKTVLNIFFELNPRKNPVLNNIFELNLFRNTKMNNFLNWIFQRKFFWIIFELNIFGKLSFEYFFNWFFCRKTIGWISLWIDI